MNNEQFTTTTLDKILAVQIGVAWAGEDERMGWWGSAVADEFGGFTQLQDLAPSSAHWLALKCVREVAKRVDEHARGSASDADNIYTIYRLGFEIDEQLDQRLTDLIHRKAPLSTLLNHIDWLPNPIEQDWDKEAFNQWLRGLTSNRGQHKDEALGRRIVGDPPADLVEKVSKMANHLWPLNDKYVVPHFKGMK